MNSVNLISSGVEVQHRSEFSSSVIHGLIRLSRWSGKETSSSLYNSLKCCKNFSGILLDPVTQFPFSPLTASIWLCLLQIMVERWKNFEFLSPFSLNSLDFCRHKISLLRSHSDSSDCKVASDNPLSVESSLLWMSLIVLIP